MNRTMIVPAVALAFLCVPVHAQLVTYDINADMTLSGNASMNTSAYSYLVPPSGCFPPPSNDSASHPAQLTPLYPFGNADNFFDTLTAGVTTCAPLATVQGNYLYMVTGTATNSSLHATYSGVGDLEGEANDTQPPCGHGVTSGAFDGSIGSGIHTVYIPFNVTALCFMKLDAQAFYLGDTPGDLLVEWNTDLVCTSIMDPSGSLFVEPGDPLDAAAALCCIPPGEYFLHVTINAGHNVGGRVSCSNQFEEEGGPVNVGFTLNINFQDFCSCEGDLNNDGSVNVNDLLAVIAGWGPCPTPPAACPGDANHDGVVDVNDQLLVIGAWGACPCCLE